MAVASMFTWTDGLRPARRSRSKRGGVTTANMKRPWSMVGWTSLAAMYSGDWKGGGGEGVEQLLGQRRLILVHERDRGVLDLARRAGRLDLDRQRERVDDEQDHHLVAQQAADLLEAQVEDVQERDLHHRSCFRRPRKLRPRNT